MHLASQLARAEASLGRAAPFIREVLKYDFKTIVDFGCGFGLQARMFAQHGRVATGIDRDIDPYTKGIVARTPGLALIEGTWGGRAEQDAGYSYHTLEHARDPVLWLNQWGNYVKPGGKMFVGVPRYVLRVACTHLHTGWNCGQLMYLMAVAGWDCRRGRFKRHGGSVWGIADRPTEMTIADTSVGWNEVADRVPRHFVTTENRFPRVRERQGIRWDCHSAT